jgi:LPXTG-motif cell wall-anchored protein
MDMTMGVRIVAGFAAVIGFAVVLYRRRRKSAA